MHFRRFFSAVASAGAVGFTGGVFYHERHSKVARFARPWNARYNVGDRSDEKSTSSRNFGKDTDDASASATPIIFQDVPDVFTLVTKFGIPSHDTLRTRLDFVLSYDRRNRVPNWVMEHLTDDMFDQKSANRAHSKFLKDETVHPYFRASEKDYSNSGYDKGHLAPASHHSYSQKAMNDTFVLSNIVPQHPSLNRGLWKRLEHHVKTLVKEYENVYVCSGPLYLPRIIRSADDFTRILEMDNRKKSRKNRKDMANACEEKKYIIYEVIGENNVAVPSHFFKVILCETSDDLYDLESYIMPNEPIDSITPLEEFMVPRDAIERAAGFLIFSHLPDNSFRRINGGASTDRESDSDSSEEYFDLRDDLIETIV